MFVRDLKGGIMKVIFEFDTDSENFDKFQLQSHYQAEKMTLCLLEIFKQIREWDKYDSRSEIPAGEVRDTLTNIIYEYIHPENLGIQ